uniref:helix-turn-helix domain-containing protein n=1 Tax=Microbacterium proteolyticum TaxID=1572644 RepID=UPI00241758E8|nr:helix-turn-helix domain-containing protein [Microbacterium proteolyticum]
MSGNYERFIELDDMGWSARMIAAELHVNERTVTRWRQASGRLKQERQTRHPDTDRQTALDLIEQGASLREAANTVGVTEQTIRRWFPDVPAWSKSQAGQYGQMSRRLSRLGWAA